ncbi:grainyhead-like protein 3 homolog [Hippoglossus hippoglossus]|uniref:grainyhead-like protein 3 homolog n=1 Tax=Hippoglossus hippoglossus TaxID=8267 RepID=UPI00148CFD61|nr:grainyhead-like protein 3 homolog [Hippoglossus hippoglossus]XP_035024607.1 grainyhead-like protein 3 homolog [Hippoglossus stenolepis]
MTKETETLGLVFQSENFNYNQYTNCNMDSWSYPDTLEQNHSKPRLHPGDDLAALTMLYEQCKSQKDQKIVPCHRGNNINKMTERSPANANELVSLDVSANVMKLLSENIPISHPQEILGSKLHTSLPISVPTTSDTYTTLTSVVADTYDKQELNIIFDSLLQKWPETGAFPDHSSEALPYSDPFPEDTSSPVYSGSYTSSPQPERFRNEFQFSLGAPSASGYKSNELPMVYLNKGQFYPITLQGVDSSACLTSTKVKTVVMAVFENDKSPEMQLRFWNHWHARQPTVKQRVIDIADYKEVFSGISNIEEVAFNALSFVWNPSEEAKVYIGINSLSTDFSSQKGVKGLPLNLQIDTYDFSSGTNQLLHRAACQVKIFCDKGAERKMRDEDRKRSKRRVKGDGNAKSQVSSSMGSECTFFRMLDDHVTQPVLFIPEAHLSSLQRMAVPMDESDRSSMKRLYPDREQSSPPPSKQARKEDPQRVLLYVRAGVEEVFDALMLSSPTLSGLQEAISEKYGVQKDTIGKIYKKCKRGIFVNMDDNIIEHYTNQSAFLIEMSEVVSGQFQVTLVEV